MSVKIIADSTCDLSKELLEKYEISILPLHIVLGDKEYKDGLEILPDEIYAWSNANKEAPKTSAASISDAMELFESNLKNHGEIVCFSISGQMSTTVNVMRMAAEELDAEDKIHIIDSENLSTGGGLLVIEAAIMASAGKSGKEIVNAIEQLKPQVRASFIVDTLTFLHRGGRCSGVAALAGGALKLHPKIVVENGGMKPDKKYRGKMSSAILTYAKELEPQLKDAKADRVFITHSGCTDEIIQNIYEFVKELNLFDEILITRAGGVISSHCGPGTLGVLFIANN
jgi:DegV family protein with EDD domain